MVDRPSSPFGELLRRYRTEAHLTQRELAERAALSLRTVKALERGVNQRPMAHTMRHLVDALELGGEERRLFEAASRGDAVPLPLPRPVAPFVGRAAELEGLAALLHRPEVRLLTLVGTGGTGKTRIAVEAAQAAQTLFSDGVSFIPLAALSDPGLLLSTIAHALGVRESTEQSIEECLVQWLRPKEVLLLLDNLEHLVAAGPEISRLLEACPRLMVMLTSRVVLHLSGEHLFPVPPMSVPSDEDNIEPAALEAYDATALFHQRARAVDPEFSVTPESAPVIAAICARLDGLPLAIELAAAQSRLFSPAALLDRLRSGIGAVGEGPQDVPARQHTLRDTIDWSYRLLTPQDQRLFESLSVFAGGCSIDAATAVCEGQGGRAIERGIERLLDASLLQTDGSEGKRISMLDTIREYAAERLHEIGEEETIRRRHAANYATLAEEAHAALSGPRIGEWLDRLETEHDNLRAALSWLLEHDVNLALEVSGRLGLFWFLRNHWEEGVRWLESALDCAPTAPPEVRGEALNAYGRLQFYRGNHTPAVELLEESTALLRESDNERRRMSGLYHLGFVHMERGELDAAQACFEDVLESGQGPEVLDLHSLGFGGLSSVAHMRGEYEQAVHLADEAVALARRARFGIGLVDALGSLGTAATGLGDYARAEAALQEALDSSRELGLPHNTSHILAILGELAWEQGKIERAQAYQEEALAVFRQGNDVRLWVITLANLGKTLLSRDDLSGAVERLRDGLRLARETGEAKWVTGGLLSYYAQTLSAVGQAGPAVTFWAASRRALAEVGYTASLSERDLEDRMMERARAMLDEAAWEEAQEAGEAMNLEEAVDLALAQSALLPSVTNGEVVDTALQREPRAVEAGQG